MESSDHRTAPRRDVRRLRTQAVPMVASSTTGSHAPAANADRPGRRLSGLSWLVEIGALLLAAGVAALAAQGDGNQVFAYVAAGCVYAVTTILWTLAARLPSPAPEGVVVLHGDRTPMLRRLAADMDEVRVTLVPALIVSEEDGRRIRTRWACRSSRRSTGRRSALASHFPAPPMRWPPSGSTASRCAPGTASTTSRRVPSCPCGLRCSGTSAATSGRSARRSRAAREIAFSRAAGQVGDHAVDRSLAESGAVDVGWEIFWSECARPALDRGLRPGADHGLPGTGLQWHGLRPAGRPTMVPQGATTRWSPNNALKPGPAGAGGQRSSRGGSDPRCPGRCSPSRPTSRTRRTRSPRSCPHGLPFSTRLTVPRRTRIAASAVLGLIVLSLGPMTAFFVQIALGPLPPRAS